MPSELAAIPWGHFGADVGELLTQRRGGAEYGNDRPGFGSCFAISFPMVRKLLIERVRGDGHSAAHVERAP
ncbi:hypothetical protein XaCFBP7622_11075 [Xanthomonas arboricola]|nr:hypothetical protein XaCFBP7622_11075 [Xanthomonas arboricola]